jgi:putative membrane protein insertion efficiency factor
MRARRRLEAEATSAGTTRAHGLLWAAGWPVRAVVLSVLGLYRRLVSPLLGPRCRFHPSCSAYAEDAVRVHGAAKGLVLAVWRVLRCSPLTDGGVDPVPVRGAWPGSRDSSVYDAVTRRGLEEA